MAVAPTTDVVVVSSAATVPSSSPSLLHAAAPAARTRTPINAVSRRTGARLASDPAPQGPGGLGAQGQTLRCGLVARPQPIRQLRFTRPPGACELLLVRHGESAPARDDEPFPLVDGQGDPELHPDGRLQAERVADRLGGEEIDAIYVTNLRRTPETAAPLAGRLGLEARVEPDLREVHLGDGRAASSASGSSRAIRSLCGCRGAKVGRHPGRRAVRRLSRPGCGGLDRIAEAHQDRTVVVGCHGGTTGAILADATESRPFAFIGADNARSPIWWSSATADPPPLQRHLPPGPGPDHGAGAADVNF